MQDVNFREAFNVSCYQFLRARSGNMVEMRRAPAILLVFLFSFSLIAPALFVDAESNLPACCRRYGKHHCGMSGGMSGQDMADVPPSGPVAEALLLKCPFYPTGATLPEIGPALVVESPAAVISVAHQMADAAQAKDGHRISHVDSHQKRGPPALLS
jgi:hypothetical protein